MGKSINDQKLTPSFNVIGPNEVDDEKNTNKEDLIIEHDKFKPKVRVERYNSLFLIDYSEIPSNNTKLVNNFNKQQCSEISNFNIYIYIDIPTIDYYTDEMTDNKLSRFNKKFKLHLLRDAIYQSFTNGNENFWEEFIALNDKAKTCTISISSSGSLRYVETIRFLMEACYESVMEHINSGRLNLKFKLEVSPTSHKWFTTFLSQKLISENITEFLETGSYLELSENSSTPFKEYYARLNSKFSSKHNHKESLESIIIVTNLTGVKALLTILSDRPLTSYILQDSIEALHDNGLTKKPSKVDSLDASEEDTPLKRESSSLLSFQNSLVTSNKDKSVRIRSMSLNRKIHRGQGFTSDELMIHKTTSRDPSSPPPNINVSPRGGHNSDVSCTSQRDSYSISGVPADAQDDGEGENGGYENESEEDEEEEEELDEERNDSDDGISFSVRSKLSRSGSSFDISESQNPTTRRGRFRSLSLIDPALQGPFKQREQSTSIEPTEDEDSSFQEKKISNIYVHDGEFDDLQSSKKRKKKINKTVLSRQSSANGLANGLIPPEFYSRISSPSTSASSSNSSLQNLNMAPGTFSKWLGPNEYPKDPPVTSEITSNPLFEKKLIDKSFEEHRKQNSINLFTTLIGGLNLSNDRNPLALNFKTNKTIPAEIQILDEEDLLMSGFHNGNGNFTAEETSEDERKSTSTVVGEDSGISGPNSITSHNLNRKPTLDASSSSPHPIKLDLDLNLYDTKTDTIDDKKKLKQQVDKYTGTQESSKPKYKKAIQLDLYGDDDLDNMGGWILGGNAR